MTCFPSAIDSPDFSWAKNVHFSLLGRSNLMTQLITGTLLITSYLFIHLCEDESTLCCSNAAVGPLQRRTLAEPLTSFPLLYEWASIWGKAHAAAAANSC